MVGTQLVDISLRAHNDNPTSFFLKSSSPFSHTDTHALLSSLPAPPTLKQEYLIAGSIAGIVSRTFIAPIERVSRVQHLGEYKVQEYFVVGYYFMVL